MGSPAAPGDAPVWPEWERREAALQEAEAAIRADPQTAGAALRFRRACLLDALGRTAEAQRAYLDVLSVQPDHAGALNNLGTLLHAAGFRRAARTAYAEAAARHPDDPAGHVNLANVLHEAGDLAAARRHYEAALRAAPDHPEAHQGLGRVLADLGETEAAGRHRALGHRGRAVTALPYRGAGPPVGVLLLVCAAGGNVPVGPLLDDRTFRTFAVAAEFHDPADALPPHHVVFNAIGDAERCGPALEAAAEILGATDAPLVNRPEAVRATGRAPNAGRMAGVPGVVAPAAADLSRDRLSGSDAQRTLAAFGLEYPLLLRAPGFHTGQHLLRVDGPDGLPGAVAALPGRAITVLRYLEARSPDGKVRKYRVMIVDGRLYPLHLAIASHWKVHYVTADMADHPEHRAEEARFLADMAGVLGPRAVAALGRIRDVLGLDYGGIDFGLGPDGQVLFFEANATMVANPPGPDPRWDYRRAAVGEIHAAARRMLLRRAGRA